MTALGCFLVGVVLFGPAMQLSIWLADVVYDFIEATKMTREEKHDD